MIPKIFILPLLLLFSATSSLACDIDIYANENMKPKVYFESEQPKGILVEMMQYVGKDINCQFNFKFSAWARAYKNMLNGNGGVIGLSKTESREKLIDYSDVMYMEEVLLITHIDNAFKFSSVNDLAGKTVISARGAIIGEKFESAVKNKIFTLIMDNGDIAKRLERVAKGRIDVAIVYPGKYAFDNAFVKHPELLTIKDQLYVVPTIFSMDPNFLGFSKQNNHRLFLKQFNQSMKKGRKSGVFKKIEDKYHQLQQ